MPIYLRQELTNHLVYEIHGGYDQIIAAWEDRSINETGYPEPIQRSSLYRWVAKGVPARRDGIDDRFFALCGLLDVDPLVLFDFKRNGYFDRFAKLRQAVYLGRAAIGGYGAIFDMYRPSDNWPSDLIAKKYFSRPWYAPKNLTNKNDWENTNYILIKANFTPTRKLLPRAVHVAYRRVDVPDTMWRYYGSVLSIDGKLELYTESGRFTKVQEFNAGEIRFRTYFGGRPVEWRIASLHEFERETEYPCHDQDIPTFKW